MVSLAAAAAVPAAAPTTATPSWLLGIPLSEVLAPYTQDTEPSVSSSSASDLLGLDSSAASPTAIPVAPVPDGSVLNDSWYSSNDPLDACNQETSVLHIATTPLAQVLTESTVPESPSFPDEEDYCENGDTGTSVVGPLRLVDPSEASTATYHIQTTLSCRPSQQNKSQTSSSSSSQASLVYPQTTLPPTGASACQVRSASSFNPATGSVTVQRTSSSVLGISFSASETKPQYTIPLPLVTAQEQPFDSDRLADTQLIKSSDTPLDEPEENESLPIFGFILVSVVAILGILLMLGSLVACCMCIWLQKPIPRADEEMGESKENQSDADLYSLKALSTTSTAGSGSFLQSVLVP